MERGWLPFAALILACLLIRLPFLDRLERWIGDAQCGLVSRTAYFSDAVVVDIDEASLRGLRPRLGNWPYDRDIYGLIFDYLNEQGAAAVVFDILMIDGRQGDRMLAQALHRHGNGVLSAAIPTAETRMTDSDLSMLDAARQPPPATLPRVQWPALLIPSADLLKGAGRLSIGVAAAVADDDGVLRRMPMAHETNGVAMPSLLLAALETTGAKQLGAGAAPPWPTDRGGFVHLYFPANANAVMSMPFLDVAEAALGVTTLRNAGDFFRGKTVFIGSTAYISDRVVTPRGPMSGTYMLAVAHQTLRHGLVWAPSSAVWDALVLGSAFVALFGFLLPVNQGWRASLAWSGGAAAMIWVGQLGLLAFAMQPVAMLPALLTLALGWTFHVVQEQGRLRRRTRELEEEADLDSLTGLPVRRALLRTFRRELASARRYGRPLCVAIVDLDHFKRVNDTYGHGVGDLVLKTFAEVLRLQLRASDAPGRWGGEEFVVLLPDTDIEGAMVVLEKIRMAVGEERFPTPAHGLRVTMSAGVAQYDGSDKSMEDLLHAADLALYQAKEAGRNRVRMAE